MYKRISFIIALVLSIQIGNSQVEKFFMSITPEAAWTNKTLNFSCMLQNTSNKFIKMIPLLHDCSSKYYPIFWEIHVKRNDNEYYADTLVVLGQPPFNKLIRIHPRSKYEFNFCIDFTKLVPVKNEPKREKNMDFGLYTVQIEYLSKIKIKRQLMHLSSNSVSIIYK